MAGIANAITSLVDSLITALNARNAPGASDYQMWLAQGNTGTLDDYRRIVAGSAMTDAQRQALTGTALWNGRMVTVTDTGVTWKYVSASTGWKAWDSGDWLNYPVTPLIQGINGAQYASPGWNQNYAQYRYVSGQVHARGSIFLNGGAAIVNAQLILGMPVPYSSHSNSMFAGQVKGFDSSAGNAEYALQHSFGGSGGSNVWLGYISSTASALSPTGQYGPFQWAQSDSIAWHFIYDPA